MSTTLRDMIHRAFADRGKRDITNLAAGATGDEIARLLAAQHGNKGRTPEEMKKRWVASDNFVPMTVPVDAVQPVRLPSGRTKSNTVGPIVIDDNFRNVEQKQGNGGPDTPTGVVPPVVIIDGQHRWADAKEKGETELQAVVGEKAIPKLTKEMFHAEFRKRHSRSGNVERMMRRLGVTRYAEFKESEHPRDESGEFTEKGGGKSATTYKPDPHYDFPTPESLPDLFEEVFEEVQQDKKLSPNRAKEIAAARVRNHIHRITQEISDKVAAADRGKGSPLTEAEEKFYDSIYVDEWRPSRDLEEISGSRSLISDSEDPEGKVPITRIRKGERINKKIRRNAEQNVSAAKDSTVVMLSNGETTGFPTLLIHPSARHGGKKWQMSRIDVNGNAMGHSIHETKEDAIRSASGLHDASGPPIGDSSFKVVSAKGLKPVGGGPAGPARDIQKLSDALGVTKHSRLLSTEYAPGVLEENDAITEASGDPNAGESPRIDRSAFLYMEPKENLSEFGQCGTCFFWQERGRCVLHGDLPIDPDESCGLYIRKNGTQPNLPTLELVTPQESGLYDGPVRCQNCRYLAGTTCSLFVSLNQSPDFNLDPNVKPQGCCNAFQEK